MTHAEMLRSHANLAIKEGGMYYSGEYLSRIAKTAESLEAENVKLRELTSLMWRELHAEQGSAQRRMEIADRMRELFGKDEDGSNLV